MQRSGRSSRLGAAQPGYREDGRASSRRCQVSDSKTTAGVREVDMSPFLREDLLVYRASLQEVSADGLAFPSRAGTTHTRQNINRRVIAPAVRLADERRSGRGESPLPPRVTAHTFRRTYVTMCAQFGRSLSYVQAQVGHTDANTTNRYYVQGSHGEINPRIREQLAFLSARARYRRSNGGRVRVAHRGGVAVARGRRARRRPARAAGRLHSAGHTVTGGMTAQISAEHRVILGALVRHGVSFVLIGGVGAHVHGWREATLDVDISIATDDDNVLRMDAVAGLSQWRDPDSNRERQDVQAEKSGATEGRVDRILGTVRLTRTHAPAIVDPRRSRPAPELGFPCPSPNVSAGPLPSVLH